jgi:phage baseplate assembly protein W
MTTVDVPFHFDDTGRTGGTTAEDHVRDLIEQVLLTAPGERVMRPDFGSGLLAMPFEPNSPELASALQFTMQAALQRWLGDLIEVRRLEVTARESTLAVVIEYALQRTGEVRTATVERASP